MKTTFSTKLGFAASGSAGGIIANGLSYYLLIYYSQALGLDPALTGLALMIALVFDAVSDPLIGRWSDRTRHKWGRRHPFLIFSIVPIALFYYLLWAPPDLDDTGLFFYLLILIVSVRLALTAHSVPFNALLPEIAPDYDARTSMMNYSYSASWFIGTLMAVLMHAIWITDTPEYPDGAGVLRAGGYVTSGLVGAIGVFFCLIYATYATYRFVPQLSKPPQKSESLKAIFSETIHTLDDRNFLVIAVAGIFSAAASGTGTALWVYIQPYFWGFDSEQMSIILAAQLLSAIIAFFFMPVMSRGREKKILLIIISLISLSVATGPVFLSLLGLFPVQGGPYLFPTMVVIGVIQVMLIVMTGTLTSSVLADVVDARAVATGRREEGLVFSVQSFIGKVSSGVGIWTAGIILAVINFPTEAAASDVSAESVIQLGWLYGPVLTVLYLISVGALTFYSLDRQTHARNLEALEARA